jgi:hypothetical protein
VEVAPWIKIYQNTVRFNRHNIGQAIEIVKQKIYNPDIKQSDAAAWIVGGVAVLALLALLSDKK